MVLRWHFKNTCVYALAEGLIEVSGFFASKIKYKWQCNADVQTNSENKIINVLKWTDFESDICSFHIDYYMFANILRYVKIRLLSYKKHLQGKGYWHD